jgi:hypothetical protein
MKHAIILNIILRKIDDMFSTNILVKVEYVSIIKLKKTFVHNY